MNTTRLARLVARLEDQMQPVALRCYHQLANETREQLELRVADAEALVVGRSRDVPALVISILDCPISAVIAEEG